MIREFIEDESGQDIAEYSLVLVLVGVAALVILTVMGTSISEIFSKISNRLSQSDNAAS